MKNYFFLICMVVLGLFAKAQNGLENIYVERYYVADAIDAANSHPAIPVGAVTYRIYADMLPGYKVQSIYGSVAHNLTMTTSTYFFNQSDYGDVTPSYSATNAKKNTVMLDSWLTTGGTCTGYLGVPKSEDNGSGNFVNSNAPQLLQNNAAQAGIPLTTQDGMWAGTVPTTTMLGLDALLPIFGDGSANGNSFVVTNGAWACLAGAAGPIAASNKVLIAQITTDGVFHFELNIQIGTPSLGTQNYVASNPSTGELSISSLTQTLYPNPVPPTVTTASVSNLLTTTAICGGNVIDDGHSNVTARGVCWSTSSNPSIADFKTVNGTGTGAFTSNLTGLTAGATYHVRAYATNDMGTSYGDDVVFTTPFLVTFNVDMSTALGFIPGADLVYIAGNFPGASWNAPGSNPALQLNRVGSTLTYTLVMNLPAGTYQYKYFKNAGWDGGEYTGGDNRSVTISTASTINDIWGGSINWANLQWPGSGTIDLGSAYNVYAQAYIANISWTAGGTYGLQAWIGYSNDNSDPSTWTNWVPASFNGQVGDNDEFKANLGAATTNSGTYYYASRFQFGNGAYKYGGFSGGFWDGSANVNGVLTVNAPATKTLNVTVFLEGLYNSESGMMVKTQNADADGNQWNMFTGDIADTLTVSLAETTDTYATVYSASGVAINTDGSIVLDAVPASLSGNYYIIIRHRNHVETWSQSVSFAGSIINYNFTDAAEKAWGSNLKQNGSVFCIFTGDANGDQYIDGFDLALVFNQNLASAFDYQTEDMNGDGFVDGFDLALVFNNNLIGAGMNTPVAPLGLIRPGRKI